jgi:hypothetical protein
LSQRPGGIERKIGAGRGNVFQGGVFGKFFTLRQLASISAGKEVRTATPAGDLLQPVFFLDGFSFF